jgi:hypothetical protein
LNLKQSGKTVLFATSKVKNANPDDFATYLAKRKAAEEGRVWTPGGSAAPAAAAPAASSAPAAKKWIPADSYATRTLSRDKPFPGSHEASNKAPAAGGTHDSKGSFQHYGFGGYTPKK